MAKELFFSYIIPTIGRKTLDVAAQSVLTQDFTSADFEVIIVNDSGSPLYRADWQSSPRVRIINTNKCERSFARNSGAAIAKGKYLAFLDDDDWILPGALQTFWDLANQCPNAVWLYGGIRIVDARNNILAEMNSALAGNCFAQIMGGAWAPIQASMIQTRMFFDIGGYSPFICGTEDEDLCRRAAYQGEFASTPDTVACLFRGETWTTSTNYSRASEDTKYSRDLILSRERVFRKLMMSAKSGYWHGRILRIYLSTITWNIKKKKFMLALSRSLYAIAAFLLSIPHQFSFEYWRGVKADHVRQSLHYVIKEYEEKVGRKKHKAV